MRPFWIGLTVLLVVASVALAQDAAPDPYTSYPNEDIPACTDEAIELMLPILSNAARQYQEINEGADTVSEENVSEYFINNVTLRDEWHYQIFAQLPRCALAYQYNNLFGLLLDETVLSYSTLQALFAQQTAGNEELAQAYAEMSSSASATTAQLGQAFQTFLDSAFPEMVTEEATS